MSAIQKVNYSHDAMIDLIIANPRINQGEIAAYFGYTEGWVSQVFSSDAFQARHAQRKKELVDPIILNSIEENFDALIRKSQANVMKKLDAAPDASFSLKVMEISSRARGYGAKAAVPTVAIQQNFVAHVPPKAPNASQWMETFAPKAAPPAAIVEAPREPAPVLENCGQTEDEQMLGDLARG